MREIPLPLTVGAGPRRIVVGKANGAVVEALSRSGSWPFHTAILTGPPRSGKSTLGGWFAVNGGDVLDDADQHDESELFHLWNRAQESGRPLLLVASMEESGWSITLPDLASRLGAALHLEIGAPDDAMVADLIALHAEMRGFVLGSDATAYLVPRADRSYLGIERLVAEIDRLSLERKQAPTMALWRDALDGLAAAKQPRLL